MNADYILLLVVIPGVVSVFLYFLLQFIHSAKRHKEMVARQAEIEDADETQNPDQPQEQQQQ